MIEMISAAIEIIRPDQTPYLPMALYHLGGGILYHGSLDSLATPFTSFLFALVSSPPVW